MAVSVPHVPLRVTAHLRGGVSYDPPFGLDLAGILAARTRVEERADAEARGTLMSAPLPDSTGEEPDDYTLPLAQCDLGTDWHWAATCVHLYPEGVDMEMRVLNRGTDAAYGAAAAKLPLPSITPSRGPYRDARIPTPVIPAASAVWWAVGDPERVRQLVEPIASIGRRRNVGEGVVLRWSVETVPDADPQAWMHLGETSTLQRPCPAECAEHVGVKDVRTTWYAIRPPSWNPDRLMPLVAPSDPDEW